MRAVVIRRKKGNETEELLNVVAGPLLYVRLPEGSYTLEASLGEQKKSHSFAIGKKNRTAHVHLGWNVAATMSE